MPKLADLDWSALDGVATLGITAGASAPETLVQEMVDALGARFDLTIEERIVKQEDVIFKLPAPLDRG